MSLPRISRWAWVGLIVALTFTLWVRGHTFGPALKQTIGFAPYLALGAESEPLDCDEAIYGFMGKRIVEGAILYRDLTENKPPLGYWIYALAVKIGGMNELTIRLLPIPFVLANVSVLWWIAYQLQGGRTAFLSALTYALISNDPYVYGNSANMESLINAFATASLAFMIAGLGDRGRWTFAAAGIGVALASLVKQIVAIDLVVYAVASVLAKSRKSRILDLGSLGLGFAIPILLAFAAIAAQGATADAFDDVIRFGSAMATDTPAPPNAPSLWLRWLTGNADPEGNLPWPFGTTTYLVWWGTGAWPFWLAGSALTFWWLFGRDKSFDQRLIAVWTIAAAIQVGLPGLFWQHYYMLPLPGLALTVTISLADGLKGWQEKRKWSSLGMAGLVGLALFATTWIQVRDVFLVESQELTIRYKGGRQWVVLREIGRDIKERTDSWKERPTLFLWGWQSLLYFYGNLDNASRQTFTDDLTRNFADRPHPLIQPKIERIMAELEAKPPTFIFTGYPPFPALQAFLNRRYLPSNVVRGLWVDRDRYVEFESTRPATPPSTIRRAP